MSPGPWAPPAITPQGWGIDPAGVEEIHRQLRFRHFKWDAFSCGRRNVLPESMVLSAELHRRVVEAVEGIHGALVRFETRVRRDPVVLRRLGIPAPLHPIIADEADRPMQCARYDLFPTADGRLMVSEFNEDVPGGFNETVGLPELLGDPGPGVRWEAGLRRAVVDAFAPWDGVAMLYATAFSEDLQHMLVIERWLSEAGHDTVLASPEHLRKGWRRPRVLGVPVEAAFRFYPAEWMPVLPNLDVWRRVAPGFPMMNPIRHLVRQSKIMFALWWEESLGELAEDRPLLERHCPRTFPFDPADVDRLREERERWVLKRAFGRMGDSVVMGTLTPEKGWMEALKEAVRSPADWCVQECFSVVTLDFEVGPLYPTLGAWVVNGRFAGYYSRAAPIPFLTHEAFHVATLVRDP